MSSTPAPPTAGDSSARARPPMWDMAITIALLGVQGLLSMLIAFSVLMSEGICDPGVCDEGQLAFTRNLMWTGVLAIAGVTIAVSVLLLTSRRRAFYVPILGIAAMFGWAEVWNGLVLRALYG